MYVSKDQIMNGIFKYVKEDVIPNVPEKNFKVMITAATGMVMRKPDMINGIAGNGMINILKQFETEQGYDIDIVGEALKEAINSSGGFEVIIPAIRFIMPEEKHLTFHSADVEKMMMYIKGEM